MPARVLIVDDEKMIRWSLRASLEEAEYEVAEAEREGVILHPSLDSFIGKWSPR